MTETGGNWARVKEVFQAALEQRVEKRPAFLDEACGDDAVLRAEVESLLLAHERAGSFAVAPALEAWADIAEPGTDAIDRQLQPGDRLGPYTLAEPLGAGGMGDVFKARDTRLGRTVAIKLLPRFLRDDSDLKQRFEREARTLATLSHPHICPVFDVGHQDGIDFLVMEHLEGETLADRLRRSRDHRLQVDEAIAIAIQIASALAAVHRAGIVHRDLKPGNVMLTRAGAKLLDFGLAKSKAPVAGDLVSMRTNLTAQGTILGTVEYMPPEQVEGKEADARTDLFAFGLVLFEMLTGRRAFEGDSAASMMAAILEREPPLVSRLQPLAMPTLDRIVSKCLAKDPDERWQSAKDLCDELKWSAAPGTANAAVVRRASTTYAAWIVAAVVVAAAAITATLFALRPAAPDAQMTRLDVNTLPSTAEKPSFALSPDGRQLAFAATSSGVEKLWLRPLDHADAQPLADTDGASFPFWSPDSRALGFFADGKLKRLDLGRGGPVVLADAPYPYGGTWNRDNVIVFAPDANGGLMRVAATGGTPTGVTRRPLGEGPQRLPWFLPDGRRFLFHVAFATPEVQGVYLGTLDAPDTQRVLPGAPAALYAPPGHLLTVRQGALVAVPFDVARGTVSGEPVAIAAPVVASSSWGAFSASTTGLLAYRTGVARDRQLIWLDRDGRVVGTVGAKVSGASLDLASDGQRVVIGRVVIGLLGQQTADVWLIDTNRGVSSRFTFGSGNWPVWSPDGSRVAFSSWTNNTQWDLSEKPANGASEGQRLLVSSDSKIANDWSPDGRSLLYANWNPATGSDLWALPLDTRKPFPVVETRFNEDEGQFSPDGRWIAYRSNQSGRDEIYVQAFPGPAGKQQVSTAGGSQPRWRRNGKELFYVAADTRLMSVPMALPAEGQTLRVGVPVPLFRTRLVGVDQPKAQYAVAPDGQRFLMNVMEEEATASPITIIQNWTAALKK